MAEPHKHRHISCKQEDKQSSLIWNPLSDNTGLATIVEACLPTNLTSAVRRREETIWVSCGSRWKAEESLKPGNTSEDIVQVFKTELNFNNSPQIRKSSIHLNQQRTFLSTGMELLWVTLVSVHPHLFHHEWYLKG